MYKILKILCKLTLLAYFRKVKISGKEHLKTDGPYIFVANHPSAFMDPVVVGTSIKPTVFFLVAGEYMGKGFKFWFFHKFLHMIPIYRPDTMPGDTHKNKEAFAKSIAHLSKGKCLLVFPEGVSVTEKKILPLKTGVARIARETILAEGKELGLKIIPVGLNYTDPHAFRSDLFVNIGEPIEVADFISEEASSEKEEVRLMTDHIEQRMIDSVLHMETEEVEEILDGINRTYSRDLKYKLGVAFTDQNREFELNKLTISAVKHFQNDDPAAYDKMKSLLDQYIRHLDAHGIKDKDFRKVDEKTKLTQLLYLIFGFPIFFIGCVLNFIPYQLNSAIQKALAIKDSFKGSVNLLLGLVIFTLWYSAAVVTLWWLTPLSYFSLSIPLIAYLSGTYALVYTSVFKYLNRRRKLKNYLSATGHLKEDLLDSRNELMKSFESYRKVWDEELEKETI